MSVSHPVPSDLTRAAVVIAVWLRDEVWQSHEQASQGHQDSPIANHTGPVYPAAKIAHKHNQGCVPHLQRDKVTH